MSLTSAQNDHVVDVLYNIPVPELERALFALNAEELLTIRTEAEKFKRRQERILELVDERLEDIGRTS